MRHLLVNQCKGCQRGMILLAVLWSVMALSLIVMGLAKSLKVEIKQVATDIKILQMGVLGDAAVLFALKQIVASRTTDPITGMSSQVQLWGQMVDVETLPLNGLIDLNRASAQLLVDLLRHAGGLAAEPARELAQAIQTVRSRDGGTGRSEEFEAIEDLLRVSGMSRKLYARIEPLITVYGFGSGKVNPLAAPSGVLTVLASGNSATSSAFLVRRQSLDASSRLQLDTTMFTATHIEVVASPMLMLTARMPLDNNLILTRAWIVKLVAPEPGKLPWQRLDVMQRVLPGEVLKGHS